MPDMTTIELPRLERPADLVRRLVRVGLVAGLVAVVCLALLAIEVSKECRGGAFSAGFDGGFDVRRCAIVIKKIDSDVEIRIPFPR
jgi:hypothetical protein